MSNDGTNTKYYEFEARLIAHIKANPEKAEDVLARMIKNSDADVVRMIGSAFNIYEK